MQMAEPITIHCSSLPRILSCPASLDTDKKVELRSADSDASLIGQAVHAALAHYVQTGEVPDLDTVSLRFGVSRDQVAPLFFIGRRIWDDYSDALDVCGVEQQCGELLAEGLQLTGTADVVADTEGTSLLIWDWKSGVATADHRAQLLGYAWLNRRSAPSGRIKLAVCYLRDQSVEITDIDLKTDLVEFERQVAWAVAHPNTFCPSWENCRFCPRQSDCPARRTLIRATVADLSTVEKLDALAPADLGVLYPKVKLLEGAIKHYHATLRNAVSATGPIPTGDGRELVMKTKPRSEILPQPAWPVLLKWMGDADVFSDALKLKKGELCSLVSDATPQGQKGKAIKAFLDELAEAGAIRASESLVLSAVKIKQEVETNG